MVIGSGFEHRDPLGPVSVFAHRKSGGRRRRGAPVLETGGLVDSGPRAGDLGPQALARGARGPALWRPLPCGRPGAASAPPLEPGTPQVQVHPAGSAKTRAPASCLEP